MNYFKYTLTALILASTIFFSCGEDNTGGGIQHRESNIESYSVYVGSSTGGQELHRDSIKNQFDLIFPSTVFEEYSKTYFIFLDETTIAIEQGNSLPEINKYIFQNGSFFLLNNNESIYYGEGDTKTLNIRQHYVAYKRSGDKSFTAKQLTPRKTVNKEDASAETPFASIENMKSTEDTLIWCTRSSVFR